MAALRSASDAHRTRANASQSPHAAGHDHRLCETLDEDGPVDEEMRHGSGRRSRRRPGACWHREDLMSLSRIEATVSRPRRTGNLRGRAECRRQAAALAERPAAGSNDVERISVGPRRLRQLIQLEDNLIATPRYGCKTTSCTAHVAVKEDGHRALLIVSDQGGHAPEHRLG